MKAATRLPLTDECHHYKSKAEVPWDLQKYFSQRYSIFSWYDEGVRLTDDAWFGVTPEPLANKVADEMYHTDASKRVLIDMFGGAGGNTIAFALSARWDRVISVERDAATLACAQHNAELYEVGEYITWIHGDCFEYLAKLRDASDDLAEELRVDMAETVVFASPPWGGPGYSTAEIFDLSQMEPYTLQQLHDACKPMDHALYLPRTSDLRQIAKLAPEGEKLEVVQYCMEGASKAMVAFIPGTLSPPTLKSQ
ncbi:RNA cap guanine-N2 methyltransferase [Colletotrichum higginsianum]|uniref:Trimethylguanosine synthase n=2 Tax=Colletotrichum higginsianum TaxID=80884 RepID=H1V164_COLHI|nr:RNA cap guanine-N2 methyltransferase [Colletotrichum higginsianum IMI 349063]OBR15668.1 RNA cap guanine-N2 methyltransferase [Colletotrichum higginsianum IMI 349063]TID04782.1 Trimethylguanosine synthase [Colletotrichum higginsianum]CCF33966.1 RNA cap guanine-N2 methyltransferase [Colletotrichum higginsianum]